jgi:hypothetical protein
MLIPAGVLDADPVMRPENNIVRTSKSRDAPSLRQWRRSARIRLQARASRAHVDDADLHLALGVSAQDLQRYFFSEAGVLKHLGEIG